MTDALFIFFMMLLQPRSTLFPYTTSSDLMLRDEIEATVHRTIQKLPEDLRTALTLREFDGLSYEDIAGVMQRSEETRLNSSHVRTSYAVSCLKKKNMCRGPHTT